MRSLYLAFLVIAAFIRDTQAVAVNTKNFAKRETEDGYIINSRETFTGAYNPAPEFSIFPNGTNYLRSKFEVLTGGSMKAFVMEEDDYLNFIMTGTRTREGDLAACNCNAFAKKCDQTCSIKPGSYVIHYETDGTGVTSQLAAYSYRQSTTGEASSTGAVIGIVVGSAVAFIAISFIVRAACRNSTMIHRQENMVIRTNAPVVESTAQQPAMASNNFTPAHPQNLAPSAPSYHDLNRPAPAVLQPPTAIGIIPFPEPHIPSGPSQFYSVPPPAYSS